MKTHSEALAANSALLRQEIELSVSMQTEVAKSGVTASLSLARRQAYVSGLISIYGLLEQTVDDLLEAIVRSWALIYDKHSDVDEAVRTAMRQLTLQALLDSDLGRGRAGFDETRAVASIQVDLDAAPTFEPFVATRKTANYRHPLVVQMLKRIGIEAEGVFDDSRLAGVLAGAGFTHVASFLEDLTERRNEMSHRMISPDSDILQRDALIAYLEVITAYLLEIVRVIAWRLTQATVPRLQVVGPCREAGDNYVAFDLVAGSLRIGDVLVFVKETRMSAHAVKSLQINRVPLNSAVTKGSAVDVGVTLRGGQNRRYKGAAVYVAPTPLVAVLAEFQVSDI